MTKKAKSIHLAVSYHNLKKYVVDACGSVKWYRLWPVHNLPAHLANDPSKVTCKRCRRIIDKRKP